MIIIRHMPPKNAHGWHSTPTLQQISAPPPLHQCHYLQCQCHHSSPCFSFMYEEARPANRSAGGGQQKGTHPEQFMFNISVIESHSYIKVRKWGCKCKVGGPWKHRSVPQCLFFFKFSPPLPSFGEMDDKFPAMEPATAVGRQAWYENSSIGWAGIKN